MKEAILTPAALWRVFPKRAATAAGLAFLILAFAIPVLAANETVSTAKGEAKASATVEPAPHNATMENKAGANALVNALPVVIEHEGDDKLGEQLAFKLKEIFQRSEFFRLARKDEKAVKLKIVSRAEIAERPYFGSAYSVVWLFAEGKDVLAYYLDSALGFVSEPVLDQEAAAVAAHTDKVAGKYSYLME